MSCGVLLWEDKKTGSDEIRKAEQPVRQVYFTDSDETADKGSKSRFNFLKNSTNLLVMATCWFSMLQRVLKTVPQNALQKHYMERNMNNKRKKLTRLEGTQPI